MSESVEYKRRLSNLLRRLRVTAGFTRQQICQELHISSTAISMWESGKTVPTREKRRVLERLYGSPITDEIIQKEPLELPGQLPEPTSAKRAERPLPLRPVELSLPDKLANELSALDRRIEELQGELETVSRQRAVLASAIEQLRVGV